MNSKSIQTTNSSFRFWGAFLVSSLCLLEISTRALAQTITIEPPIPPGKVRMSFHDIRLPFDTLNGIHLTGQSLSLDFLFANQDVATVFTDTYFVGLEINTDYGSLPGYAVGSGYLTGLNGAPLQPASTLGSASSTSGGLFVGLFAVDPGWNSSGLNPPFSHYGVHYEITLPLTPNAQVLNADLRLLDYGDRGLIFFGDVPEGTTTLFLLSLSLGAVLVFGLNVNRREGSPRNWNG